jgi:hypothetical protein
MDGRGMYYRLHDNSSYSGQTNNMHSQTLEGTLASAFTGRPTLTRKDHNIIEDCASVTISTQGKPGCLTPRGGESSPTDGEDKDSRMTERLSWTVLQQLPSVKIAEVSTYWKLSSEG